MARKTARSSISSSETLEDHFEETVIAKHGDICLKVKDPRTKLEHRYFCSRNVLRTASEYFDVLLDPVKFSEGVAIEARLQELYKQYDGPIPSSDLPTVAVADAGELLNANVSMCSLLRLFLRIIHDPGTPWPVSRSQSVTVVALLAVVADRFAAQGLIATYLRQQMLDITLLKDRKPTSAYKTELGNRQRLLAGMIFGFSQWVLQCSAALVIEGPKRWTNPHSESGDEAEKNDDDAIWWRLPGGVEGTFLPGLEMLWTHCTDYGSEELLCRREYVLDTLSSIQKHFIALYSSRQRQCRLGYGSSPNCDSYQLGESIRFCSRKGLLRVESAFATTTDDDHEPYNGNIDDIIAKLRECPSYQIDRNHSHCGMRTRLMPILDSLWPSNSVWICLDCWRSDRGMESWLDNPKGGKWEWRKKPQSRVISGCQAHREAKAMFTADSRDWTPV